MLCDSQVPCFYRTVLQLISHRCIVHNITFLSERDKFICVDFRALAYAVWCLEWPVRFFYCQEVGLRDGVKTRINPNLSGNLLALRAALVDAKRLPNRLSTKLFCRELCPAVDVTSVPFADSSSSSLFVLCFLALHRFIVLPTASSRRQIPCIIFILLLLFASLGTLVCALCLHQLLAVEMRYPPSHEGLLVLLCLCTLHQEDLVACSFVYKGFLLYFSITHDSHVLHLSFLLFWGIFVYMPRRLDMSSWSFVWWS